MPEGLKKLLEPFLAIPPAKRWLIGGVVGLSLATFAILIVVANRTDYRPLFAEVGS